jgi:hypothetical protein
MHPLVFDIHAGGDDMQFFEVDVIPAEIHIHIFKADTDWFQISIDGYRHLYKADSITITI